MKMFSLVSMLLCSLGLMAQVDPHIGTGGTIYSSGMTFPGAAVPFGMVRLSPDTKFGFPLEVINRANVATAGTHSAHRRLLGFSHTRLEGAGLKEGGAFRITPMQRPDEKKIKKGLLFDKDFEQAVPGEYGIILDKEGLTATLSATAHCGIHRYRSLGSLALFINPHSNLAQGTHQNVKLALDSSQRFLEGEALMIGDFSRRYGGQQLYMYGEVSKKAQRIYQDEKGLWLIWETQGPHYVDLKICFSGVKKENAKENFNAEVENYSIETIQQKSRDSWKDWLGRIEIISSSEEIKTIFKSALYRTGLMPTNYSDVNGDYRSFNNTIRNSKNFNFMSDLSLWDTFRTTHPLYTLIAPEIQRDSILSLLDMAELNNNRLPLWPQGSGDGGSMFGYPAHFLIAEAWAKGIRDFDSKLALSFMSQQSFDQNDPCVSLGYCPADQMGGSVSKTLEKAWANGVSATFAESIGETETSLKFHEHSLNFKHIWQDGFFRPRKTNGEFKKVYPLVISYLELFNLNSRAFAEGSPHHWRYSVPHRPEELIELFGGKVKFVKKLDRFMRGATENLSAINPGPYYWHGNEHDFHVIYLFNEAGRPDLTQSWARWALETRYANSPKGLDGNDDGGALSAWYVFSALGLYPQAGTNKYWLGSPNIEKATLQLGEGRTLKILTQNNSPTNVYVQEAFLNGKKLCRPQVLHQELINSELLFKMGRKPALSGGFHCD